MARPSRLTAKLPVLLALLALVLALALAACGGGGSSSSSSETTSGSTEAETTEAEPAEEEETETAGTVEEPPTEPSTEETISQPLKSAPPKGKKVVWLACELPICQGALSKGWFEAGEALGWNVSQINYNSADPNSIAKAMQQAINENADAISISGIPPVLFEAQAKEAIKKGIPIISTSDTTKPEPEKNGVYYQVGNGEAVFKEGEELMNWSINNSEGDAHVAAIIIEEYAVLVSEVEGMEKAAEACSKCTVDKIPVTITELGEGKIPAALVAYLQGNPETNVVAFTFSDLTNSVYSALKGAGLNEKLTLVGAAATPPVLEEIIKEEQDAWTIQPQNLMGWLGMDVLARLWTNTPLEKYEEEGRFPTWTADSKETAESLMKEFKGEWPGPEGFPELFKELWGV